MKSITERLATSYRLEPDGARAVHWESEAAQYLRFARILDAFVHRSDEAFRVLDAGCGLGALKPSLEARFPRALYVGADVVAPFVASCRERFPGTEFLLRDMREIEGEFDYTVVSGVFNEIPPDVPPEAFTPWIVERVEHLFSISRCGLVANFIADVGLRWRNPKNYYADPAYFLAVAARLSRFFSLRHDYPLYEMTISILKPEIVRERNGAVGDWR